MLEPDPVSDFELEVPVAVAEALVVAVTKPVLAVPELVADAVSEDSDLEEVTTENIIDISNKSQNEIYATGTKIMLYIPTLCPAEEQMLEKAFSATWELEPQLLVIAVSTFPALVPQMVARSEGSV